MTTPPAAPIIAAAGLAADLFGYVRTCELPGCDADLSDRRRGARFCCQAHQVEAWKRRNAARWQDYSAAWRAAHPDYAQRWHAARRRRSPPLDERR